MCLPAVTVTTAGARMLYLPVANWVQKLNPFMIQRRSRIGFTLPAKAKDNSNSFRLNESFDDLVAFSYP